MSSRRQPGDWNCGSCRHHNFSWRDSCNSSDHSAAIDGGSNFLPGDWYCLCGGHNFASRSSCHCCGAPSNCSVVNIYDGRNEMHGSGGVEYGSGSRIGCTCARSGCNQHNFFASSWKLCYRCKAPKGMPENDDGHVRSSSINGNVIINLTR